MRHFDLNQRPRCLSEYHEHLVTGVKDRFICKVGTCELHLFFYDFYSICNKLCEAARMNKILTAILFFSATSFYIAGYAENMNNAQTGAGQTKTMQTQMMTHEMARDMSKMMQQMTVMTRDMNRIMDKTATMDQTRTRDMAQVMDQLSQAMHSMSQNMAAGKMDENMMREMEQHMNRIREMIQAMEQKK